MTTPHSKEVKVKTHGAKKPRLSPVEIEEQTLYGMRIQRIGRGHYRCHSTSREETAYAVDLSENNGLGSCECEDFIFRRLPQWKSIRKPYDALRCRHLRIVRNHVLDQIIAHFSEKQQNP